MSWKNKELRKEHLAVMAAKKKKDKRKKLYHTSRRPRDGNAKRAGTDLRKNLFS